MTVIRRLSCGPEGEASAGIGGTRRVAAVRRAGRKAFVLLA